MNICRISYIQKNINNPSWKSLTIEGVGREAGFNSRVTLFKAIKKHTGQSPSKFFETHQLPE
jgi:methylphosphotriester-DNA--protein-cysteine methyltransferase